MNNLSLNITAPTSIEFPKNSRNFLLLKILLSFFLTLPLCGVEIETLKHVLYQSSPPFNYPLDIKIYPGKSSNEDVILCCHGYGADSSTAGVIASYHPVPDCLIGFNFPDYNITSRKMPLEQMTYGTIDELLPAVYLLKKIVIDVGVNKISLYGFSAGGAAVVNLIALLNTSPNSQAFHSINVSETDIQKILSALQKGIILLDAPLKSLDEFNAAHPESMKDPFNLLHTQREKENAMIPINNLAKWKGLKLSVVLFFQNPDLAVSNRDDNLFAEKLIQANPEGKNLVISKNEGGHLSFHSSLWKGFLDLSKP